MGFDVQWWSGIVTVYVECVCMFFCPCPCTSGLWLKKKLSLQTQLLSVKCLHRTNLCSMCWAGSPLGTPEPLVLLTPPRCLTANRTQHGVLLTWLPPANHSSPIDRYIMEFRLGERWEVLDDLIPSTETELIARDLVQVSRGQMIPPEFTD